MKKLLVALLLLAMVVPCVFAEGEAKSGINWNIIDSVGLQGGFEHVSMRGKFISEELKTNKMTGFGFAVYGEVDLSEIPDFMKPGWYAYVDFGMEFAGKVTFNDTKYDKETLERKYGIKTHLCLLRKLELDIPVEVRVGGGIAYNALHGKAISTTNRLSARALGLAIIGEGVYKFNDHFGASLVADFDMSLLTKIQHKYKTDTGYSEIGKHTSFGFGLDIAVRAGVKYII